MSFFKVENSNGEEIEIQSPVHGYYVSGDKKMFVLSDDPPAEIWSSSFKAYLVNPSDHDWKSGLFLIGFGMFGTRFLVWAKGAEDALEEAASAAMDAGMKGFFVDDDELQILYAEAREDLGPDADDDEVMEQATADLTYTETGYITAYEWTLDDVNEGDAFGQGQDLYAAVKFVSEAYMDEDNESLRYELTPNAGRTNKRGHQPWPGTWVRVYVQPKAEAWERYTAVLDGKEWNKTVHRGRAMMAIGENGGSYFTEGEEGRHLGKEVTWDQLPAPVRRAIEKRAKPEHTANASHYDDYIISVPRMSAQRRLVYAYNADDDGWGQMIGLAHGFDSEKEAFAWCQSHAFQRGKQSALVFREKHGGDVVQLGHVGETHRGGSYQPNATR